MPETIGQQLKKARLARNLSIQKAVEATRIRSQYIELLESDDFSAFASPVQGRGFLRNYSEYLGLDPEILIARQREEFASQSSVPDQKTSQAQDTLQPSDADLIADKGASTLAYTPSSDGSPASQPLSGPSGITKESSNQIPRKAARGKSNTGVHNGSDYKTITVLPKGKRKKTIVGGVPQGFAPDEADKTEKSAIDTLIIASSGAEAGDNGTGDKISAGPAKRSVKGNNKKNRKAHTDAPDGTSQFLKSGSENNETGLPDQSSIREIMGAIGRSDLPGEDQIPQHRKEGLDRFPVITASEIFSSVGKDLQQRRDLLGMNLDDIEKHIHVRKHYLKAIESGDFSHLPSSVQTRGMINNYANFLDMDADALLLRFAEGLQLQLQERHPQTTDDKTGARSKQLFPPFIRHLLSVDLLFFGGFIILFIIFIIWGASRILSASHQSDLLPTAPSISDVLLISATPELESEATLVMSEGTPGLPLVNETTIAVTLPSEAIGRVHVIVIAMERAYVRVTVDGQIKFDGRVIPDTAYPFDANNGIEVLTANGAAIKIVYNGEDLGTMGTYGQVVHYLYGPDSVMTPTPTATPLPTATLVPTSTGIPSLTPIPSITPVFSPTLAP